MSQHVPIQITQADTRRGIPERAECPECGATWERPEWDQHADTLPTWGRGHRCELAGAERCGDDPVMTVATYAPDLPEPPTSLAALGLRALRLVAAGAGHPCESVANLAQLATDLGYVEWSELHPAAWRLTEKGERATEVWTPGTCPRCAQAVHSANECDR